MKNILIELSLRFTVNWAIPLCECYLLKFLFQVIPFPVMSAILGSQALRVLMDLQV